ncbi:MAG: MFS transporter [Azospirillaceae bacterium]|nr:MFS transporter [Azospirillaceae bacterium]
MLLGGFVVTFDVFVVNVAIPGLKTDIHADFSQIGFIVAGYALAFGTVLITGGRLGDIYGRRRMFVLGMAGFSLSSVLCGLAFDPESLIAARLLQGTCGAILLPQVYALLRVLYDDAGRRRAFGLFGMVLGLAAIAGQILGGLIVWSDLFGLGWRIIFFLNLPIGLVAIRLAGTIPESKAAEAARLDGPGLALVTIGLILLLVPLLEGEAAGWPTWTAASGSAGFFLLVVFVLWERWLARAGGSPTIDFALFGNRGFAGAASVVLLIYSTPASFFLCFSLMMQSGFGVTPLRAGSLLTPMSIGFIGASLIANRLVTRFGYKAVAGGMVVYAAGFFWLCQIAPALGSMISGGVGHRFVFIMGMVLFGIGQGLSGPPLLSFAIGFVEAHYAGMAAGIISTMQQIGGAFGIAIVSMLFMRLLAAHPVVGHHDVTPYAAAFAGAMLYNVAATLAGAVLILWITRTRMRRVQSLTR